MLVTIDLTDTSGYSPALGDRVEFEAKNLIGSASVPGRVITTAPVKVELESGQGQVSLEPGPHIMRIRARNYRDSAPVAFTVPDEVEEMTLRELLDGSFVYEPNVVQEAQQYFLRTREMAEVATEQVEIIGGATRVLQAETASATSASDADNSANEAGGYAAESKASAEFSQQEADRATEAANTAASDTDALLAQHVADSRAALAGAANSAAEALDSAASSSASATASAGSASASETSRQAAETAKVDAEGAAEFSAEQADDSSDSADAAALSATVASDNAILSGQNAAAADVSAGNAQDAADEAANDVRATLAGYVSDATASKDAAATSETNAAESEDAARQSAIDAAEAVSSGVPDATADSKGKLRLTGDLGGTADAPTVPGLEGKADTGHTHSSSEVDGLDPVIESVNEATYQPDGSTLMRRTSSGRVSVAAPSEAANAANKQYVDQAVLTKVDTTSTASRLYGTSSAGSQELVQYASSATENTIPYRATGGTLQVGEPTDSSHAATKTYVDSSLSDQVAALTSAVQARPATFSGEGEPPSSIPGAVSGDWWVDTTDPDELKFYKITGV